MLYVRMLFHICCGIWMAKALQHLEWVQGSLHVDRVNYGQSWGMLIDHMCILNV
jgi:hypothetical protein